MLVASFQVKFQLSCMYFNLQCQVMCISMGVSQLAEFVCLLLNDTSALFMSALTTHQLLQINKYII